MKINSEESKTNHNNDLNDSKGEEEEIDNKVKCEILEADNKIKENYSNKNLINFQAQSNSIKEKEPQYDSESDEEEDGHDNQSDVEEERKIGEKANAEKFEEEKI